MAQTRVLVTGAGGFIGRHLVSFLKQKGSWVGGVDIKVPEYSSPDATEFEPLDLHRWDNCLQATCGVDEVCRVSADMGGSKISIKHIPGPMGVRGRSSNNTRLRDILKWEPQLSLEDGLRRTCGRVEKLVAPKLETTNQA